jgi:2,4-dichlorophenol 6-monooxygenase
VNGYTQRRAEETKALIRCYEFNCHGVAMNQRYASAAVIPDGTPEPAFNRDHELYHHATTWPGAHLPHVWVEHHGVRKSTLDLAGKGRFTLLTGIGGEGWRSAAAAVGAAYGVSFDVVTMLFMPRGIWGEAARHWNVRLFPTQRVLSRNS